MHGTLLKVLAETGQVEVQLEIGQKYWVPYDRVEFKETKPQMQENEYGKSSLQALITFAECSRAARTYNTKAKEPIPSRAIPVPPTPTRLLATTQPASRPSHIQQASQRTINTETRNAPHYPHSQAFAYPRPPMPHAHRHEQRPPHPSQYMQDPRIPTRVVVCDSAPASGYSIDFKQPGYYPLPPPPHERTGTWPPTQRSLPYPPPQGHQATYIPPPLHFYGPPPPVNGQFHGPPSHGTQGGSDAPTPMSMGPPPFVPPGGRSDKIDLTMAHMRRLMKHLPPLRIPAIHLAGTNGKGSVSAILESILKVAGLRTARYNSPHLIEARDAIRVDGVPPSKAVYDAAVFSVQRTAKEKNIEVSPFELATATAYYIFATSAPAIDVMVIECGMGGVNDATNVIPPQFNLASALTSVGLDHTNFLGNTISAIADQKARITVPGGLLFIAPHLHRDALRTVQTIGRSVGAGVIESFDSTILSRGAQVFQLSPFLPPAPSHVRTRLPVIMDGRLVPGEDCIGTRLSLGGKHQLDNLSLALTILHVISKDKRALSIQPALGKISPSVMQRGVELTKWEGRCSWVQYQAEGRAIPILVDGAHNADSAKTLRAYIDDLGPEPCGQTLKKQYIISLSSSPGKSPESVLGPLLRKGDKVTLMDFTTPVEGMPWVNPADKGEVQRAAEGLVGRGQVEVVNEKGVEGLKVALGKVEVDELAVVCGSLYLVADVYRLVQ
jgi:folylpolyglutamate synthase/dihydrofolate synthase